MSSSSISSSTDRRRRTGYVFEERYMWHDPGFISYSEWVEPGEAWENVHTKRRIHNLLNISNMIDNLIPIKARMATKDEICRFHTPEYHDKIVQESNSLKGGDGGELAPFTFGGYNIASLSAGGFLRAVEEVVAGSVDNAYCLVRPPGHHAVADKGMGFCIFNNIALGALHAKTLGAGIKKIAIVDYDVLERPRRSVCVSPSRQQLSSHFR
jgi:acetoin utilization deacetylase AcuC-like enzyme